jgi:predicted DNA-binding transcriptional regulator AlpA
MQNRVVYSAKEAAIYLGVSKSYLANTRCYSPKEGPPYAKIGKRVVYPAASLQSWLDQRMQGGQKL